MTILHTFISPRRYAQGAGALAEAGTLIQPLGTHAFVLYDRTVTDRWARQLRPALIAAGLDVSGAEFAGECTQAEIDRVDTAARVMRADIIVGLGGGKVIDTAKAVADDLGATLAILPTLASTDAPTSALSVIYTNQGIFDHYRSYRHNPDLVLVDTQVIADAPVRLFIAGIGDALSTYFEARATAQSYATTMAGGWQTVAAAALARACWDTIRVYSMEAITALRAHRVTDAVEKVVEANTLLSGLGSESGGLAAAHAIHNGLTALPETHGMWHGEKVAFGTLVLLELEKHNAQYRRDVLDFCLAVGLPVCFADLGVPHITPAQIATVAERALATGETIYNEPCTLSPETVMEALRSADARGRTARAVTIAA
ncbi:MAG: glycerol dehydrogenase [Acetobacteraceae bacterium]